MEGVVDEKVSCCEEESIQLEREVEESIGDMVNIGGGGMKEEEVNIEENIKEEGETNETGSYILDEQEINPGKAEKSKMEEGEIKESSEVFIEEEINMKEIGVKYFEEEINPGKAEKSKMEEVEIKESAEVFIEEEINIKEIGAKYLEQEVINIEGASTNKEEDNVTENVADVCHAEEGRKEEEIDIKVADVNSKEQANIEETGSNISTQEVINIEEGAITNKEETNITENVADVCHAEEGRKEDEIDIKVADVNSKEQANIEETGSNTSTQEVVLTVGEANGSLRPSQVTTAVWIWAVKPGFWQGGESIVSGVNNTPEVNSMKKGSGDNKAYGGNETVNVQKVKETVGTPADGNSIKESGGDKKYGGKERSARRKLDGKEDVSKNWKRHNRKEQKVKNFGNIKKKVYESDELNKKKKYSRNKIKNAESKESPQNANSLESEEENIAGKVLEANTTVGNSDEMIKECCFQEDMSQKEALVNQNMWNNAGTEKDQGYTLSSIETKVEEEKESNYDEVNFNITSNVVDAKLSNESVSIKEEEAIKLGSNDDKDGGQEEKFTVSDKGGSTTGMVSADIGFEEPGVPISTVSNKHIEKELNINNETTRDVLDVSGVVQEEIKKVTHPTHEISVIDGKDDVSALQMLEISKQQLSLSERGIIKKDECDIKVVGSDEQMTDKNITYECINELSYENGNEMQNMDEEKNINIVEIKDENLKLQDGAQSIIEVRIQEKKRDENRVQDKEESTVKVTVQDKRKSSNEFQNKDGIDNETSVQVDEIRIFSKDGNVNKEEIQDENINGGRIQNVNGIVSERSIRDESSIEVRIQNEQERIEAKIQDSSNDELRIQDKGRNIRIQSKNGEKICGENGSIDETNVQDKDQNINEEQIPYMVESIDKAIISDEVRVTEGKAENTDEVRLQDKDECFGEIKIPVEDENITEKCNLDDESSKVRGQGKDESIGETRIQDENKDINEERIQAVIKEETVCYKSEDIDGIMVQEKERIVDKIKIKGNEENCNIAGIQEDNKLKMQGENINVERICNEILTEERIRDENEYTQDEGEQVVKNLLYNDKMCPEIKSEDASKSVNMGRFENENINVNISDGDHIISARSIQEEDKSIIKVVIKGESENCMNDELKRNIKEKIHVDTNCIEARCQSGNAAWNGINNVKVIAAGTSYNEEENEYFTESGHTVREEIVDKNGLISSGEMGSNHIENIAGEDEVCLDTKVGKWMLFLDKTSRDIYGDTALDRAWKKVAKLVGQGELHAAKCSTAIDENGSLNNGHNGVIICYTTDYTNVEDVKRAADIIRSVIKFPRPLFYKTDKATYEGKYRGSGSKHISLYKHETNGKMFIRDGFQWKPAALEMVEKMDRPSHRPSEIQFTTRITAKEDDNSPFDTKAGKWMLFLDKVEKDDEGNTELDRAWLKIKALVDDGLLVNAVCTTGTRKFGPNSNDNEAPIFCYTHHYGDITSAKQAADTIREVVHFSKDMVYKRNDPPNKYKQNFRRKSFSIYKHTKDCVFYEKVYGKWISRSS